MSPDLLSISGPALPIAETFLSIQGEGKLAGTPSFFIRVSGCNLRCSWCDTPYASWNPEGSPRTIDSLIDEARASGARHAVLTGGEPMIFPQLAAPAAARPHGPGSPPPPPPRPAPPPPHFSTPPTTAPPPPPHRPLHAPPRGDHIPPPPPYGSGEVADPKPGPGGAV